MFMAILLKCRGPFRALSALSDRLRTASITSEVIEPRDPIG
jgi:hypothetical protein